MKRSCLSPKTPKSAPATKKGVASLYVVIFTTLLFGVITVSFARIILSEAAQSSNDDLSRSAYDAALAGVEDAKTYVNRYYNCIKDKTESECGDFDIFSNKYIVKNGIYDGTEDATNWNCDDGFPLYDKMNGSPNSETGSKEVLIQEGNTEQGEFTDQAYTCVLVSDVVPDYRGTLSKDTRTKVIPLGIDRGAEGGSGLQAVQKVRFSWYSDMNRGTKGDAENFKNLKHGGYFRDKSNATVPPTMQLSFIRFNSGMNIEDQYHTDNTGTDYSTMVFLPTDKDSLSSDKSMLAGNHIDVNELKNAGNVRTESNGHEESIVHEPYLIECTNDAEFACSVEIDLPGMTDNDTAFLVASLPYGDAYTDFAVTLLAEDENGQDKIIYLKGVQISVDSTGRTNQLVRRVEARLDPADLFFPYPQYALELGGGDDKSLQKDFWVTNNCWYSNPSKNELSTCPQNGTVGSGNQLNAGDLFPF